MSFPYYDVHEHTGYDLRSLLDATNKPIHNYDTHNQFQFRNISQTGPLDMFINRKFMSNCRKRPIYLPFFRDNRENARSILLVLERQGH